MSCIFFTFFEIQNYLFEIVFELSVFMFLFLLRYN